LARAGFACERRGGQKPAAFSRRLQYSQVLVAAVVFTLIAPASFISPGCKGCGVPSNDARNW
jgi:hypothetical protein